jgi:hypothetical protein
MTSGYVSTISMSALKPRCPRRLPLWEITDLNLPRKSATLCIRCLVKEDGVTDGEAIVLVPTRD